MRRRVTRRRSCTRANRSRSTATRDSADAHHMDPSGSFTFSQINLAGSFGLN
jgi:hypothetical protein